MMPSYWQMVHVIDLELGLAGVHGKEELAAQVENPCIGMSERLELDLNDF